ncbi:hypothetical protein M406DRAFT_100628 [Cryphonectria parasitica EP155]|uniref:Uncharacterized protein n=1 Tax=Cryphonectria parasitica (strain ATCC 38755 / EP155) TaxID=660469 RepID=A0A9P5CSU1_CRYP1|nr:uncharacterized protein M406DRAFT_100628 [Cryphonectria parasitica EP155]KAF3769954.1 hypothetical protein M406DRAFT_100628 [Cryphonectria parasitica EP155]
MMESEAVTGRTGLVIKALLGPAVVAVSSCVSTTVASVIIVAAVAGAHIAVSRTTGTMKVMDTLSLGDGMTGSTGAEERTNLGRSGQHSDKRGLELLDVI